MIVAHILAKLEADSTNMVRNAGRGADSIDKLGKMAAKSARDIDSSMSKMGATASRESARASKAVGNTAKAVDGATGAHKRHEAQARRTGETTSSSYGKASAAADKHSRSMNGLKAPMDAVDRSARAIDKSSSAASMSMGKMVGTTMKIGAAIGITTFFAQAVGAATGAIIQYNQSLEQSTIGMTTMLGSAEKAGQFMGELQDFAAKTPFSFQGLVSSTQSMMAMGFEAKNVLPNLRAVGDATAAMGGSMEDMGARVIRALGQMRAKGKVSAEEMMQIAEAGLPAWQYLADAIGTDVPAAMEQSKKVGIQSAIAIDAIMEGMTKDFGGMMDAQSKTLMGSWSTVLDYMQMNVAKATKPLFDAIKGGVLGLSTWMSGPQALNIASKFTEGVVKSFAVIQDVVRPSVMEAVGLFQDLISVGEKLAPRMKGAFTAIGGSIVLAFKGLETVISALDSMIGFIDRNEWAMKALAVVVTALMAKFVATQAIAFFSAIIKGARGAAESVGRFTSLNAQGMKTYNGIMTEASKSTKNLGTTAQISKNATMVAMAGMGNATQGFATKVKNAGSNLMGAFGGPAGIAVTAGIALIGWKMAEAAKKTADFNAKIDDMAGRMKAALQGKEGKEGTRTLTTLDKTRVIIDYVYDGDKEKGMRDALRSMKLDSKDLVGFIMKDAAAIHALDSAMDELKITGEDSLLNPDMWDDNMMRDGLLALADASGDAGKAAASFEGKNLAAKNAVMELDKALVRTGSSSKKFVSTGLGKELVSILRANKGIGDKELNKLADGLESTYKAYKAGTLTATEFERAILASTAAAKGAPTTLAELAAGQANITKEIKTTDKALAENIDATQKWASETASTWNSISLKDLADMMGLKDIEKEMQGKFKYILVWTANLAKLQENGMSTSALTKVIEEGPAKWGKAVGEMAKSPKLIEGFNEAVARELSIEDIADTLGKQVGLVDSMLNGDAGLIGAIAYAERKGFDLFEFMAKHPEMVSAAWAKQVEEIKPKMKAFMTNAESALSGGDFKYVLKEISVDPEAFKMSFTSAMDSILATMPSLVAEIDADPKAAHEAFDTLIRQVVTAKPGVEIKGVTHEARISVKRMLTWMDGLFPELHVMTDPDAAIDTFNSLLAQMGSEEAVIALLADPAQGEKTLKTFAFKVDKTTGKVTIDGIDVPANSVLTGIVSKINKSEGNVTLNAANQTALADIEAVRRAVAGLPALSGWGPLASGYVSAPKDKHPSGIPWKSESANGNIFEQHTAQIAPGGTHLRMWAEPETGGEAYIPLSAGKRPRSEAILDHVARLFGKKMIDAKGTAFAEGGFYESSKATTDLRPMIDSQLAGANKYINDMKIRAAANAASSAGANVSGVNPQFMAMFQKYSQEVGGLKIISAFRSRAQQEALYASYLNGTGNLAARPGTSNHEKGLAIDHAPGASGSMKYMANEMGMKYSVPSENWHIEPHWAANGAIFAGTTYANGGINGGTRGDENAPRGWNWKTMGDRDARGKIKRAFPSGLVGDLDGNGAITNKEWKNWQSLISGVKKYGDAKMLNLFTGGKLHENFAQAEDGSWVNKNFWSGRPRGAFPDAIRQATYDNGGILYPGYTMAYNGTGKPETITTFGNDKDGGGSVISNWNINGDLDARLLAQIKAAQERRDRRQARKMRKR